MNGEWKVDGDSHKFKTDLLTVKVWPLDGNRWGVRVVNAGSYVTLSEGKCFGGLEMAKTVGLVRARDVVKQAFAHLDDLVAR